LRLTKDGAATHEHLDYNNYLHIKAELLLRPEQIISLLNSEPIIQLRPPPKDKSPRAVAMHMPEFVIRVPTDGSKRQIWV
jgi:hypothetical protein